MLSPQFHDDIKKLSDQMDRESVQKWVQDEAKKRMDAVRADIKNLFYCEFSDGDNPYEAYARVLAALALIEEDLVKLAEKSL